MHIDIINITILIKSIITYIYIYLYFIYILFIFYWKGYVHFRMSIIYI